MLPVMTGKELRRLRTGAGLSQRRLALLLEMHPNTIARLERGELVVSCVVGLAVVSVCSKPKKEGS
jgi:transcriptional regulator with XRE-family HTH domain